MEPARSSRCESDDEITLIADDRRFRVDRKLLMDKCQYFGAMFGGDYRERSQKEVHIPTVTGTALEYVLEYFERGAFASCFDLDSVGEILDAADYFNLSDLQRYVVDRTLSSLAVENCFKIFEISQQFRLSAVESRVKSYILHMFDELRDRVKNVHDIKALHWYLSHSNLNVVNEIDVFKAGREWLEAHERDDDVLVVLSCLRYEDLDEDSLRYILNDDRVKNHDLAFRVVEGILALYASRSLKLVNCRKELDAKLSDASADVCDVIYEFIKPNCRRAPAVEPHMVKNTEGKFEIVKYDRAERKLVNRITLTDYWWGLSVVPWNKFNLLVLGGAIKNKNIWNRSIRCYDCITEEWTNFPTYTLEPRRHSTVIVHEDVIYIIGGFGECRKLLNGVHSYNIKTKDWKVLPDLPDSQIISFSAVVHNNKLYVSGESLMVFTGSHWLKLFSLSYKHHALLSYNNCIYFTERFKNSLYCWKDFDENTKPETKVIGKSNLHLAGICKIGSTCYMFCEGEDFENTLSVETCDLNHTDVTNEVLWIDENATGKYYNCECFTLPVLNIEDNFISKYGEKWLSK